MNVEIKSWITGKVIFKVVAESLKAALRIAVEKHANLRGADLRGADLRDANLRDANLWDANLSTIKSDFWEVLIHAKKEIPFLRKSLIDGKVDGSTYDGECACLVGTIANGKKVSPDSLLASCGIPKDSSRPAEVFFTAIRRGDTPENNAAAKIAVEWIDELTALLKA